MTLNRLLFKENLKKNIGIIVISFIVFFLNMILPTIILYTRYVNEEVYIDDKLLTFAERFGEEINFLPTTSSGVLFLFAIIMGIASFTYLHNRKQVDFYHSLPIKRSKLFFNNYILGILNIIPSYIITVLIFILVCFSLGISGSLYFVFILKSVISNIIFYLAVYSIFTLSTILTGNKIISFLLGAFFLNLSIILFGIIILVFEELLLVTFTTDIIANKAYIASPIFAMSLMLDDGFLPTNAFYEYSFTKILISYLVFSIILAFICYKLFSIRKSEKSGVCIAFEKLKAPLKYFGVIMGAIYVGFFFKLISNYSIVWLILGTILGTILLHCITEIIYEFDFKAVFKNWKSIIWCSIISLFIVIFSIFTPYFAKTYEEYIEKTESLPKLENVVAVNIDAGSNYFDTSKPLKEPKNIENVIKLYEMYLNFKEDDTYFEKYATYYPINSYFETQIAYKLKNGKIKYRNITLAETKEVFDIFEKILNSKEMILNTNYLFSKDFSLEETEYFNISNNAGKEFKITSPDTMRTFVEILKKDILENAEKEQGELLYTAEIYGNYPIYSNYTETIKFIEENTTIKPEEPNLENISYISLYYKDYDKIEDKEVIKFLLENSKPLSDNSITPNKFFIYNNENKYYTLCRYIPFENMEKVSKFLAEKIVK